MKPPVARAILAALLSGPAALAAETIPIPNHPPVVVHGPMAVAQEIVAAELAFDARSEAAGPAQAMREYMDPADGLSFNGGEPARGAAAIFAANGGAHPGKLTWYPTEVFAAKGGDMGAAWGRFRFTPPRPAAKTVTGEYVTVWRKSAAGWKGILDIGTPD